MVDRPATPPPPALTGPQHATLRAIVALAAEMGYAPTVREIQQWTSASSTSIVAYRLGQLEQRGYIARAPGRSRAIRVLNDGGLA